MPLFSKKIYQIIFALAICFYVGSSIAEQACPTGYAKKYIETGGNYINYYCKEGRRNTDGTTPINVFKNVFGCTYEMEKAIYLNPNDGRRSINGILINAKDFTFMGCVYNRYDNAYTSHRYHCLVEYTSCSQLDFATSTRCERYDSTRRHWSVTVHPVCEDCTQLGAKAIPGHGCRFECDSGLLAKKKEQCDTPVPECSYGLDALAYPPQCKTKPSPDKGEGSCSAPDTTPVAGNPVRIATGNKYHVESVIQGALPLQLSYNSDDDVWHHNFHYQLTPFNQLTTVKEYTRPDGNTLVFEQNGSGWTSLAAGAIQLSSTAKHGATWLINYYGQQEYYDDQGRILRVEQPLGRVFTFTWGDHQVEVMDSQANRLTLTLDDQQRLQSATQSNHKPITFTWRDNTALQKIMYPDGHARQFHYENPWFPHHLTGITDGNGKRFATWKYDNKGRAISSEHAGGTEKTFLEYHTNNSTTVTNPLSKKTTYHFNVINGVHKVVKVEGQQTEHCAAANKEYTYYDNGLLKTKTDWKGIVTAFEYNDRGLETKRTVA
ncbi:RHS repeat protein, partial [Zooshikella ganghwensis]|uniref:RHS repeat protein n=1 Tax=Zooshikella ganghwensis TaxID=202772 RepID=UPI00146FAE22